MTDDVIDDETQTLTEDAPSAEPIPQFPDGVYLRMAEEDYHAQRRLSSSGIGLILASPADFWAKSWLNPDREDVTTDAQLLGRAFHTARLEPDELHKRFAREIEKEDFGEGLLSTDGEVREKIKEYQPDKSDYPDALFTDADVKEALAELGEKQSLKGEKAPDRQARLREASAGVTFWDDITAEWEAKNGPIREPKDETPLERARRLKALGYEGHIWIIEQAEFLASLDGRTALPGRFWDQIASDVGDMQSSPIAAAYLTDGLAEVSVLWTDNTDPEHPVKMKCRIDYLRPDVFVDVKTFDNPQRKTLRKCLDDQFKFNRYYIQAVVYREGVEQIRKGLVDIMDAETDHEKDVLTKIQLAPAPLRCTYVFQQKGGVPNVIARPVRFGRHHASLDAAEIGVDAETAANVKAMHEESSLFVRRAEHEVATSIETFAQYMAKYGEGRKWYPMNPIMDLDDNAFGTFWLEGE